jgi:hypothetical protein
LLTLLFSVPAMSVELFRYRGADKDGGTLEYIFETDEKDVPKTLSKEKAAEIAADFCDNFLSRTDRRTRNARVPDTPRFHSGSFPQKQSSAVGPVCAGCISAYTGSFF